MKKINFRFAPDKFYLRQVPESCFDFLTNIQLYQACIIVLILKNVFKRFLYIHPLVRPHATVATLQSHQNRFKAFLAHLASHKAITMVFILYLVKKLLNNNNKNNKNIHIVANLITCFMAFFYPILCIQTLVRTRESKTETFNSNQVVVLGKCN